MNRDWKTIRVFISSTFRDMQAERDHLVRFVFPRLREELLQRRIHLVDVDLRWGVTSEQDALEVCREIVDQCRPRFICILGGRYGWVPPGKDRSITADEVYYGVLDRELGKSGFAYFYFRDPSASVAMMETQPGEFQEPSGSENERKLNDLKQAITKHGLKPFIYPAKWDDNAKRLTGLKAFGDRVYEDLKNSIDVEFGTQPAEKLDEFAEENAAMESFIEERIERFVLGNRETVWKELLQHAEGAGGNGYLCLTGEAGSGKSALLGKFSRDYANTHPKDLVISHFVGASPGSTDIRRTLRRLCHELVDGTGINADIPDDPEKLRDAFPEILRQACAKKRVVIFIDAINRFDSASHSIGLYWLPEELPANSRIILSTLNSPALEQLRRRRYQPVEITLKPLSENDANAIIDTFLRRYRKRMTGKQREELVAKDDAKTPLYLLAVLEELRTLGTYEEIDQRIKELPAQTQELFQWILKRLEDDGGFRDASGKKIGKELVPRFASLLGVSRHGLSQQELIDVLSPDNLQGNVAALLHLLRPYLMRRGELLDFYHGQLRSAVEDVYLKTDARRQVAHAQLAGYFRSNADPDQNLSWKSENQRSLGELTFHLVQTCDWDMTKSIMQNWPFVKAKVTAEQTDDVIWALRCLGERNACLNEAEQDRQANFAMLSALHYAMEDIVGLAEGFLDVRKAFQATLAKWVEEKSSTTAIVVTGPAGCGKTTEFAIFCASSRQNHRDWIIIPHFVGRSRGSNEFRLMLQRFCYLLAPATSSYRNQFRPFNPKPPKPRHVVHVDLRWAKKEFWPDIAVVGPEASFKPKIEQQVPSSGAVSMPDDIGTLALLFDKMVNEVAQKTRILLVIDGCDGMYQADQEHFWKWIGSRTTAPFRIIASAEHPIHLPSFMSAHVPVFQLQPFSEVETREFLRKYFARYGKVLTVEQFAAIARQESVRIPASLSLAAEALRRRSSYEAMIETLRQLPSTPISLAEWLINMAEDEAGQHYAEVFFGFLAVTRDGLSIVELESFLDKGGGDTRFKFEDLRNQFGPVLFEHDGIFALANADFKERVNSHYGTNPNATQTRHKKLAKLFSEEWQRRNPLALSELPHEFVMAREWQSLIRLLTAPEFVETKCQAGMRQLLINDYTEAVSALTEFQST